MKRYPLPKLTRLAALFSISSVLLLVHAPVASAQSPGVQDATFADGTAANGAIYAVALQSNGQVVAGGSFTMFRGVTRNGLARLNTDGSLDAFSPGLAFSGYLTAVPTVRAVAVQADGKILAAGSFTVLNQPGGGGVARLNADGSLDSTFNVGSGVFDDGGQVGTAFALSVLPDGKILVGGAFATFNGVATAGLVRLNSDGSVDTTFNASGGGIAANGYGRDVRSLAVLGDGTIVIGGHFSAYYSAFDGVGANGVARLHADGTIDRSFNVGAGTNDGGVYAVAVQSDGKVLAGGGFNNFDGVSTSHLVRLNTDGSLDTRFVPSGSLFISEIDDLLVQPNSTLLAGGTFLEQGGLVNSPHNGLARFLPDGTQDSGFDSGSTSRQVVSLALQVDGKVVVASNPGALVGSATGNVFRYFDLTTPAFFDDEVALGSGAYYLAFPGGNYFGYYSFLDDPHYIYHYDLGYEYVFDAADGNAGVYFYDFTSGGFFYTSPTFPFPYLYDFTLNSVVYYYPDPANPGHYNTNGVRYFYVYNTGQIISK